MASIDHFEQHPELHPRRDLIGRGVGSGLAIAGLASAIPALASVPSALPAVTSTLSNNLDLKSSLSWHLARRVCPAPANGIANEIANEIAKVDYNAWIERQLYPSKIDDSPAGALGGGEQAAEERQAGRGVPGFTPGTALEVA